MKFQSKLHLIDTQCRYRRSHFCDGKLNKSVTEIGEDLPPCPDRFDCPIRKYSIFDETETKENRP